MPSGTTVTINGYKELQKISIYQRWTKENPNIAYSCPKNSKALIQGKIMCTSVGSSAVGYLFITENIEIKTFKLITFGANVKTDVSILDTDQPTNRWIPFEVLLTPNQKLVVGGDGTKGNEEFSLQAIIEESFA